MARKEKEIELNFFDVLRLGIMPVTEKDVKQAAKDLEEGKDPIYRKRK